MAASPLVSLYCFPHAGAVASVFLRFQRFLPSFIEVIPVELPGHGRRGHEPLETTMEGLVATLRRTVQREPRSNIALFGHSLGALTAFEYAHQLERELGVAPLVLFASSAHAPSFRREARPPALGDDDLRAQLRELSGTPEHALESSELMELVLPVLRADLQVAHGYFRSKGHALACPIHALAGSHDTVDKQALAGWREHTRSEFTTTLLPGHHFYFQECMPQLGSLIASTVAQRLSPATRACAAAGA